MPNQLGLLRQNLNEFAKLQQNELTFMSDADKNEIILTLQDKLESSKKTIGSLNKKLLDIAEKEAQEIVTSIKKTMEALPQDKASTWLINTYNPEFLLDIKSGSVIIYNRIKSYLQEYCKENNIPLMYEEWK